MSFIKFYASDAAKKSAHNLVDNFFNLNISDFIGSDGINSQPLVNVIEAKDHYRIEVAAPGLQKENFSLEIEKDQLKVTAKQEEKAEGEGKTEESKEKYTRREFAYHGFTRSFQLPEKADANNIEATYQEGILTITLHKKPEEKERPARTIDIS